MAVRKTDQHENILEEAALKQEQAYILRKLGVTDAGDETCTLEDCGVSSCDELDGDSNHQVTCGSSDGGYVSDEDKSASFVVDLSQQSYTDKIDNIIKQLPPDLQELVEGLNVGIPDDYKVPIDNKPDWLDMKKFKIGQQFAQKYYVGFNYAAMLSLYILLSFQDGVQPLIFTERSDTPFKAFQRYMSTALRVKSWFEHDVWKEDNLGYRNLKMVRVMHLNVSKRMNAVPLDQIKCQLSLKGVNKDRAVWSTLQPVISEDLRSGCPFVGKPLDDLRPEKVFVNQVDMSLTQFGFLGLLITYPEMFGAGDASDEDIEGFVHLWRGLGYLLGIEDKYNFCKGTLQEVRQRCNSVITHVVKPSLQTVNEDWEHMTRCMVEGISYYNAGVSFETSLLYLCWLLDMPAPSVAASLTWWQFLMFNLTKLTLCVTLYLPGMRLLYNWLICRSLTRASSWTDTKLKNLQTKMYPYETEGKLNTRL